MTHNIDIREAARRKRIPLWKIADALGITDSSFSRMLRHELSEDKKQHIRKIIDELED